MVMISFTNVRISRKYTKYLQYRFTFRLRTPARDEPVKVFDLKLNFARTTDLSNATLNS